MGSVLVKKPNILVFVLDQLSFRALDLYGGYCSMPFITSLAKDGITVSDCYCSYPLCQPSRASLWSGQYPHRNKVWSNGRQCPVTPLDETYPSLGQCFSDAGYECRHFGKKHDGGALRGFICSAEDEERIPDDNPLFPYNMDTYADVYTVDQTLRYLKERNDHRPLMMVVDLINPHNICGWIGKNKGEVKDKSYDGPLPPLPENFYFDDIGNRPLPVQYLCCSHVRQSQVSQWKEEDFQYYLLAYRYYLEKADCDMKSVYDAYVRAGLLNDDTLIVFTSDHGDNITARRSVTKQVTLYEEVTRVPLVFSGPGVKRKDCMVHQCASLLDIFPTLASYAGIDEPDGTDGIDLTPLFDGGKPEEREYVVSQWYTEWGYTISPGRMIRKGDIKYIFYLEGCGEELYDLSRDPYEMTNLARDPSYSQVLDEMRNLFAKYISESGDPFYSLSVKADRRWRCHDIGYDKHTGPSAPEV